MLLKERSKGNASAECREVRQVANDAVFVVGRTRECKTDGNRRFGQKLLHLLKAFNKGEQAAFEVVGNCRNSNWRDDFFAALNGGEHKVGAAGIKGHNDSFVLFVHYFGIFIGYYFRL